MRTDLLKRLRDFHNPTCNEAAAAIEELAEDLKYARESWGLVDVKCQKLTGRLDSLSARFDAGLIAAEDMAVRLAAAERVVEAADLFAHVDRGFDEKAYRDSLRSALADYQKAYSSNPRICGKSGTDMCEDCVGSCGIETTDLNSGDPAQQTEQLIRLSQAANEAADRAKQEGE